MKIAIKTYSLVVWAWQLAGVVIIHS